MGRTKGSKNKPRLRVTRTYIVAFTPKELMELHKKLLYKTNPTWVSLRDKIRSLKTVCIHCGQEKI